jgi:hypothetical protein
MLSIDLSMSGKESQGTSVFSADLTPRPKIWLRSEFSNQCSLLLARPIRFRKFFCKHFEAIRSRKPPGEASESKVKYKEGL